MAFTQIEDNGIIILQYFGIICSISLFNVFGVSTTKYASAAQRSTIDTSRTVLVTIFGWTLMGEKPLWWSIIGFVILVIGTLLYNEIFELPCCGFNNNTKRAIAEREGELGPEGTGDAANYMATSPHAAYDANRNKRALSRVDDKDREAEGKDFAIH